jgi:hypothetical protein
VRDRGLVSRYAEYESQEIEIQRESGDRPVEMLDLARSTCGNALPRGDQIIFSYVSGSAWLDTRRLTC